jgi:hypothetical protein
MSKWWCGSPDRSGLRRSCDVPCGSNRLLAAVQRPNTRHDPDRRHEDRDPDDTRRDSLVPALTIAAAECPLECVIGRLKASEAAL